MRRFIIIIATLLMTVSSWAQYQYCPFVEDGKQWVITFQGDTIRQFIKGDTIIQGHKCKIWWQQDVRWLIYSPGICEEYLPVYVFEEERRVSFFFDGDTSPRLFFDFNAEVGDTLEICTPSIHVFNTMSDIVMGDNPHYDNYTDGWTGKLIVRSIGYNINGGRIAKCFLYDILFNSGSWGNFAYLPIYMIEGVGNYTVPAYPVGALGNVIPFLQTCVVGDKTIYNIKEQGMGTLDADYTPMCVQGKTWNYIHHYVDAEGVHDEPYSYVVDGQQSYGPFWNTQVNNLIRIDDRDNKSVFGLVESGRQVMIRNPQQRHWNLLFDFGLSNIGQTYDIGHTYGYGEDFIMLERIDTIEVRGNKFRRMILQHRTVHDGQVAQVTHTQPTDNVQREIWVEGIGSQRYGIEPSSHEPSSQDNYSYFVSCYENGQCIFTAEDFTTGLTETDVSHCKYDSSVINSHDGIKQLYFDLTGRRLAAPPAHGLYIEDGRVRVKQ